MNASETACTTTSAIERTIRRVAGSFVLLSVGLSLWVHPGWIGLAAFVGLNLLQSSFTGFCPLESILRSSREPKASAPARR